MSNKMMPLHPDDRRKFPDCPQNIPFELLDEGMAQWNHSQTLTRLAERGGMGAYEILANMDKINLSEAWKKWKGDAGAVEELKSRLSKNEHP